tara:strand:- start:2005 stop:2193 length:189 start_codon:yes stop_codon:yes gene_type:complete
MKPDKKLLNKHAFELYQELAQCVNPFKRRRMSKEWDSALELLARVEGFKNHDEWLDANPERE